MLSVRRDEVGERVLAAASELLAREGPRALTIRAIASASKLSTMAIYSRFGGKDGVIDALYREGFELLADRQTASAAVDDPLERLRQMCIGYREVAVAHPSHYQLMFNPAVEKLEPSEASRLTARRTLDRLIEAVADAQAAGRLRAGDPMPMARTLFALCHGLVGIELAKLDPAEDRATAFLLAVNALLESLAAAS